MDELLTTKQVQKLLKVDRTTIYRMLNDGRLVGVKIGQQWRFPRQEVEALISGNSLVETKKWVRKATREVLPLYCVQTIQDVFAEIARISAVTTATDGEPLTKISNSCEFCNLIQSNPQGFQACIASWRKLAEFPAQKLTFTSCHAGLQYTSARIDVDGAEVAILTAGQFYASPPDQQEQLNRIRSLAESYEIDQSTLQQAASSIQVLDDRKRAQLSTWLGKVADTFERIGHERSELISRLNHIAAVSSWEST